MNIILGWKKMRIQFCKLWIICLFSVAVACAQSHSSQPGPHIKFEQQEINLGTVDEGTLVKHIFKFKNTGEDTLRIIRVEPG